MLVTTRQCWLSISPTMHDDDGTSCDVRMESIISSAFSEFCFALREGLKDICVLLFAIANASFSFFRSEIRRSRRRARERMRSLPLLGVLRTLLSGCSIAGVKELVFSMGDGSPISNVTFLGFRVKKFLNLFFNLHAFLWSGPTRTTSIDSSPTLFSPSATLFIEEVISISAHPS